MTGRIVGAKVVWSLRASNVDYAQYDRAAQLAFNIGSKLSGFANLIIVNSHAGKQHHIVHGYCEAHMLVIPNGIDTEQYRPKPEAGRQVRAGWGLTSDQYVIGLVGRLDILKDHPTFLRAAAILTQEQPQVRFVCVGNGPIAYATELQALAQSMGLEKQIIWTGGLNDMPAVYSALDLLTSTSFSEGFSNVIGEAMACEVACVVTNVGDSALIVGETGLVVPPKDPIALAQAWRDWLNLSDSERQARGAQARARIESEFNLRAMVTKTAAALEELLANGKHENYTAHSIWDKF
jgi:glycosyltransferase involved in cell wall biosynthesis